MKKEGLGLVSKDFGGNNMVHCSIDSYRVTVGSDFQEHVLKDLVAEHKGQTLAIDDKSVLVLLGRFRAIVGSLVIARGAR